MDHFNATVAAAGAAVAAVAAIPGSSANVTSSALTNLSSAFFTLPDLPSYSLKPLPPVISWIPDKYLALLLPVVAYWALSMIFHFIDTFDLFPAYRLHTPAEVLKRNRASRWEVVRDVVIQQIVQTIFGLALSVLEDDAYTGKDEYNIAVWAQRLRLAQSLLPRLFALFGLDSVKLADRAWTYSPQLAGALAGGKYPWLQQQPTFTSWELRSASLIYWVVVPALQFGLAICIVDTWQYFLHRAMHMNKFLYTTFHSRHHRLYVPYAYGALYNHPFEGFLLDTAGTGIAYLVSGMTTRQSMWFYTGSTVKTVDDHCGYALPWDPLQHITSNNAGYHDVHHQSWGIKTNFSQPFFTFWDRLLGTVWTGGDVSARYERTRLAAEQALKLETAVEPPATHSTTTTTTNNTVTEVVEPTSVVEISEEVKEEQQDKSSEPIHVSEAGGAVNASEESEHIESDKRAEHENSDQVIHNLPIEQVAPSVEAVEVVDEQVTEDFETEQVSPHDPELVKDVQDEDISGNSGVTSIGPVDTVEDEMLQMPMTKPITGSIPIDSILEEKSPYADDEQSAVMLVPELQKALEAEMKIPAGKATAQAVASREQILEDNSGAGGTSVLIDEIKEEAKETRRLSASRIPISTHELTRRRSGRLSRSPTPTNTQSQAHRISNPPTPTTLASMSNPFSNPSTTTSSSSPSPIKGLRDRVSAGAAADRRRSSGHHGRTSGVLGLAMEHSR